MPAGWLCCLARPGMARDCCPDNLLLLNQTGCLGNCLQLENQELKTTVSSPRVVLSALRALLNLNLYRCKDAVWGQEHGTNKDWQMIYCCLLHCTERRGWIWFLGRDSRSSRDDAEGGVGAPGALLCPADVWHFTKWYKMSNSFPSVKISVLGRAAFYTVQLRQGRWFASSWAWLMAVLSYSCGV